MKTLRTLTILAIVMAGVFHTYAQDVITLKSGEEIKAKVTEISSSEIKYKRFDNLDGPTIVIEKVKVFAINYENGTREVINAITEANITSISESDDKKFLQAKDQSRKDVIVRKGKWFEGFQTKINRVDDKRIYYTGSNIYGREKYKKIKQNKVAFTLTFDDKFKQELYPLQMDMKDFLSLPTYMDGGYLWTVFGTNRISNLIEVNLLRPDIYNAYIKGKNLVGTGNVMYAISILIGGIPLIITGGIIAGVGANRINDAFRKYYTDCLDLNVCAKYGIIITPYKTSLKLK